MRIYLVQHGQAKPEDTDPQRHLTEKGISDVKKMSQFLKNNGLHIDVIWHSGKARAAQTAEILAEGIVSDGGVIKHDGLSPNDDIRAIRNELLQMDKNIMIVGHLPFLNKLASSLITGKEAIEIIAFQKGGAVCLELSEDKKWQVCWMVIPELLR